ncbi:battenin-like isoform X2 [Babylonia areolata]|uniref:battenin-like isoform X2 n=1 Tax=Babylonia areolata TaxID=304850 RepID=UPI003FD1DB15
MQRNLARGGQIRNLCAFWILGLTNNFAYVVMLTAAHDILKEEDGGGGSVPIINVTTARPVSTTTDSPPNSTGQPDTQYLSCNPISTGAILLADILPTLLIKLTAPFYILKVPYKLRVLLVICFALASFLIVALAHDVWFSILGVVCASCSGGLGEITFLSLTALYDSKVVSAWSSGTGAAGVFGALGYAGLTAAGLSARNTVLSLVVIPVLMGVSYFLVLTKPDRSRTLLVGSADSNTSGNSNSDPLNPNVSEDSNSDTTMLLREEKEKVKVKLTLQQKLRLVPPLMKYMIPLTTVYFAEYFINQGLHELLYFNNISWLNKAAQYRWYQVDYQIGVFISRSTVTCLPIPTKWLWILPVLQVANMSLLIAEVFLRFIPSFWIMVVIVLWEGLLGGSAYVNTFYKIRQEVEPQYSEFSLGVF